VPSEERRNEEELYHKLSIADVQSISSFVSIMYLYVANVVVYGGLVITSIIRP